jgi:membrane-associated phospholipid phosphatase
MIDLKKYGPYFFFGLILTFLFGAMGLVQRYDYRWTLDLYQTAWPWMTDFTGRTLFEGEKFGASDMSIICHVAVVVLYGLSWRAKPHSALYRWRPYLGFYVCSLLIFSVFTVHSLKWSMGRARPSLVVNHGFSYTDWFVFGPQFITQGIYRGSFPSGHTANAFAPMALCYIFALPKDHPRWARVGGVLLAPLILIFTIAMAVGRSMGLAHWISDSLFSFSMGWVSLHVIYYWGLRIPAQLAYYRAHGLHFSHPKELDAPLCVCSFFILLGAMTLILGLRAFHFQSFPWLFSLSFLGAGLIGVFGRRLIQVYTQNFAGLAEEVCDAESPA